MFKQWFVCLTAILSLFAATVSLSAELINSSIREKAMACGNYSNLLRVIPEPKDEAAYGQFADYGFWKETSYAGQTDIPPGYWVYVAPNWYVWKDSRRDTLNPNTQNNSSDSFTSLMTKKVKIYVNGRTFSGELLENFDHYIVLGLKQSKTLINKSAIIAVEFD